MCVCQRVNKFCVGEYISTCGIAEIWSLVFIIKINVINIHVYLINIELPEGTFCISAIGGSTQVC